MLICVYLMNDKEEITRRTKEVEELLVQGSGFMVQGSENEKSEVGGLKAFNSQLSTDSKLYTLNSTLNEIAVYLIIALFIVKHEVQLRQQAKAWCQSHPDCPLVIRRFLSIAKQIRC